MSEAIESLEQAARSLRWASEDIKRAGDNIRRRSRETLEDIERVMGRGRRW